MHKSEKLSEKLQQVLSEDPDIKALREMKSSRGQHLDRAAFLASYGGENYHVVIFRHQDRPWKKK